MKSAHRLPHISAVITAAICLVLMVAGLILAKPLLILLAAPVAVHLAYALLYSSPEAEVQLIPMPTISRDDYQIRAKAEVTAAGGTQIFARISAPGFESANVLVAAGTDWEVSVLTHRTGILELFRMDYFSSDELSAGLISHRELPPLSVTAHPLRKPLPQVPTPAQLRGLTGPHPSIRPGDSSVLRDIHPFTLGDQLRRIDWRTSARRGLNPASGQIEELYVRRTFASGEATVMIVIDSRDSIAGDVSTWPGGIRPSMTEPTSLDLARQAGVSIADAYLAQGDRVGVEDLGRYRRQLPPGAGNRHAQRVRMRLAAASPWGSARKIVRAPHMPQGALVVMCSTFLDESALDLTMGWHRRGHAVLAIDTLPPTRTTLLGTLGHKAAFRLIMAERSLRLQQLRAAGITVVDWKTDPVRDLLLAASHRRVQR